MIQHVGDGIRDLCEVGRGDPRSLPLVRFIRLNEHYRPDVLLAELIIRSASFDAGSGNASATCFLMDMNKSFEGFVHRALRERLLLTEAEFPKNDGHLCLDADGEVTLRPDLSWWRRGQCLFAGDVKYKRLHAGGFQNGDLYQLLAYLVATDLPWSVLIYAKGEREPASVVVRHVKRTLEVCALDLGQTPDEILIAIERIACSITGHARTGEHTSQQPMPR